MLTKSMTTVSAAAKQHGDAVQADKVLTLLAFLAQSTNTDAAQPHVGSRAD
jgi:hypothetical protein